PTVADLQARRLEMTRASLRETILADDMDNFRVVVESLASEFDIMDIAMAAIKLAHDADGAAEEEETRDVTPSRDRPDRERGRRADGPKGQGRKPRPRSAHEGATARIFIGVGRSAGIRPQDLVGAIANE